MPTREQLETALRNADKAGDVGAAKQLANAIKALDSGPATSPVDDPNYYSKVFNPAEQTSTIGAVGRGVAQGAIDDYGAGGLQLLGEIGQKLGFKSADDFLATVERARELRTHDFEQDTSESPIAAKAGRIIGNAAPTLAIPGGVQGNLAKRLVTGAASGSAVGGINYVEDGDSRAENALVGAAFGGGAPVVLSGGRALASETGKRLFRGGGKEALKSAQRVADDFSEAGATPSVGQVTGRKSLQGAETLSSKLPLGNPINKAVDVTTKKVQDRLAAIADDISPIRGPEAAGRTIQKGIDGFVKRFQAKSGKLWNEVDDLVGKDQLVSIPSTKQTLSRLVRDDAFSSILNDPKIAKIKAAIGNAGDSVDYASLRSLRSVIGEKLGSNDLVSDIPRAQLKQLYGALSDDIGEAVMASGDGAAKAFQRANNFTRSGHKRLDDFVERVSKKVDLDKVFDAVTRGGEGSATINAFKRSLKSDEWEAVVANVVRRLGKSTPGNQNASGDAFSLTKFLTDYSRLGPARKALFSGSKKLNEYSRNLDRISRVAETVKDDLAQLANPSGTGPFVANVATGVSFLTSASTGNIEAAALIGLASAGNNVAARLMTNQRFVKWLASSTTVNSSKLPSHIAKLSTIVENQQDAIDIQQYLEAIRSQTAEKSDGE